MEYLLGIVGPSNKKADKGTITHKVLEIMASLHIARQNNKKKATFPECGDLSTCSYDINQLVERVYKYYTSQLTHHKWTDIDFRDCKNWVWKVLKHNGGQFDPRKLDIVKPEMSFDILIDQPWAIYEQDVDGVKTTGLLGIKGTIDFVGRISDTVYECVDYKTGKRLNWATGEVKDHECFKHDPQLRMYHYAIHKTFPQLEQVIMTIFYINDGGPFSICFDKADLPETEDMLQRRFTEIKNCRSPKLNKSWKCSKLCFCGMNDCYAIGKKPLIEFRDDKRNFGKAMTICEQIEFEIQKKGLDKVVKEYTTKDFSVSNYRNPGEV